MPANRSKGKSLAYRAFRILRAECADLYDKGWSANGIMEESHRILDKLGVPRGGELRSRLLVAVWNFCPRQNMPSINDMLANNEQFDVPDDSPCLEAPWWSNP